MLAKDLSHNWSSSVPCGPLSHGTLTASEIQLWPGSFYLSLGRVFSGFLGPFHTNKLLSFPLFFSCWPTFAERGANPDKPVQKNEPAPACTELSFHLIWLSLCSKYLPRKASLSAINTPKRTWKTMLIPIKDLKIFFLHNHNIWDIHSRFLGSNNIVKLMCVILFYYLLMTLCKGQHYRKK